MRTCEFSPLVGIFTSKGKYEDSFRGDTTVFKSIQKELMKIGGLSYVFTTDSIGKDTISGYIFYEKDEKWGKVTFPFPDIIYNKISSRVEETSPPFLAIQKLYKEKGKYFFNPCFFNKWEVYCTLSNSNDLSHYLPKTWVYSGINDILDKLSIYKSLFIKPVNGNKGKGIYKLSFDKRHYFIQRKTNKVKYFYSEFVQDVKKLFEKKEYLLQTEVTTDSFNDCKYDLRVICLYNNGFHTISGIGVRKAQKESIITHIPNGGEVIPFEQVKHKCSRSELNWLAKIVGEVLSKKYGFIGEFSMDIGITPNGKPIIFEVNSKPMLFDEVDIQRNRVSELVKMFKNLNENTSIIQKEI